MKFCPNCKTEKAPEEFYKCAARKSGLHDYCKSCMSVKQKAHRQTLSPEARLARGRKYRKVRTPEQRLEDCKRAADWAKANPERYKAKQIMCRYGLSLDRYNEILTQQNNACAACKTPFIKDDDNPRLGPHVDHCHETGKVRGILCALCNIGLGYFFDSPLRLKQAITYLEDTNMIKLNNKEVVFKICETHAELRYAGERCPVCVAIEDRDLALGRADEEKTQLEGRIDDLEQQVDAYRTELRL